MRPSPRAGRSPRAPGIVAVVADGEGVCHDRHRCQTKTHEHLPRRRRPHARAADAAQARPARARRGDRFRRHVGPRSTRRARRPRAGLQSSLPAGYGSLPARVRVGLHRRVLQWQSSEVLSVGEVQKLHHKPHSRRQWLRQQDRPRTGLSGAHGVLLPGGHLLRARHCGRETLHLVYRSWRKALRQELLQAGRRLREREHLALLQGRSDPLRSDVLPAGLLHKGRRVLWARSDRWVSREEVLPREPGVLRRDLPLPPEFARGVVALAAVRT